MYILTLRIALMLLMMSAVIFSPLQAVRSETIKDIILAGNSKTVGDKIFSDWIVTKESDNSDISDLIGVSFNISDPLLTLVNFELPDTAGFTWHMYYKVSAVNPTIKDFGQTVLIEGTLGDGSTAGFHFPFNVATGQPPVNIGGGSFSETGPTSSLYLIEEQDIDFDPVDTIWVFGTMSYGLGVSSTGLPNTITFQHRVSQTPLPSTLILLAPGLLGIAWCRRKLGMR